VLINGPLASKGTESQTDPNRTEHELLTINLANGNASRVPECQVRWCDSGQVLTIRFTLAYPTCTWSLSSLAFEVELSPGTMCRDN